MAARIFLAHASEDKAQVRQLYAALKARGFDPWLDEVDLLPGQIWKTEIPKAIREAGIFVACLSSRSVGKVGYLQNEFRLALSAFSERPPGSIYLIPVRLDDCDVPDLQIPDRGLSLRDIQWVDQWREGGFDRLVRAIEKALEVPSQAPKLRRPGEAAALRLGVAPDQAPVHIASDDTDVTEFLSQPIDKDTLSFYTKWRYPKLPINSTVQEHLLRDISYTGIKTLEDLDRAVEAAADAVDQYKKEAHDVFRTGTDFLTKSLGFVDKEFRAKHGFSSQTQKAFLKYEHLVQSEKTRDAVLDQKGIAEPPETPRGESAPERERHRQGSSPWRNPTVVAAIVGAIGAVAAASSPWLLEKISDGSGTNGRETEETSPAKQEVEPPPGATPEAGPMTPVTEEPFRDCTECPEMVVVPAGSFKMGSPAGEEDRNDDEGPQHRVAIPKPFAVGRYEVTRAQYAQFVEATGRRAGGCYSWNGSKAEWEFDEEADWRNPGFEQSGDEPAVCVSWEDAQAYVSWLREETGEPYRLLSEAEWEYVARAGTTTPFHTGETISTDQANYNGSYTYGSGQKGEYRQQTVPVGSFDPNAFGLHDVHGNVWEWVEDCWNNSYEGAPGDGSAWTSGDCNLRVLRGGSWLGYPRILRSAGRGWGSTVDRLNSFGFRVARTLR